MSQDDLLQSTKTVIQGLDALKCEHNKMLDNVVQSMKTSAANETNKLEEKANLLRKSMDMIDLGKRRICPRRPTSSSSFLQASVSAV